MRAVGRFFSLLWRRRVLSVGAVYLLMVAVLAPSSIILETTLGLPAWMDELVLAALTLGFIPTVVLAWTGSAGLQAATTPPPGPVLQKPGACIAVLPFTNLSRETADEIFADGIVEDLITGLSMNSTLTVVSRSSTFAYKDQSPDAREVAADLGVDFILEGSVRRTGQRLRVTVQLIEAEGGVHVWAEKYERGVSDFFDLQDDLVCAIAAALGDAVVRAELQRVRRNPSSVSAWEESMRSLVAQERPTLANVPEAVRHARNAIEMDPDFALGHARLAMSLTTNAQLVGGAAAAALLREADDHVDRALMLSPNDPKVLGVACSTLAHTGREAEAIACGVRALELNPYDSPVEGALANAYFRAGRYAEAAIHYDEEERMSPRSPFLPARCVYHALTRIMLGEVDKAEAVINRGLELDPGFEGAWVALALLRMMRGDLEGAAKAVISLRRLNSLPLEGWLQVISINMPKPREAEAREAFKAAWAAAEAEALKPAR